MLTGIRPVRKNEKSTVEENIEGKNPALINYIDTIDICRHLKKLTCKGTLRHKEGRRKGREGRKGGSGEGKEIGKEEQKKGGEEGSIGRREGDEGRRGR